MTFNVKRDSFRVLERAHKELWIRTSHNVGVRQVLDMCFDICPYFQLLLMRYFMLRMLAIFNICTELGWQEPFHVFGGICEAEEVDLSRDEVSSDRRDDRVETVISRSDVGIMIYVT